MEQYSETAGFDLIYVITNCGTGSRVLQLAKRSGISGGAIFFGKGTVSNRVLKMLALSEVRKEIVLMMAKKSEGSNFLKKLNKEYKLYRPDHGIAYSVPIAGIFGSRTCNFNITDEFGGMENTMYQSLIIIVDKGKGEAVVEAAAKAGAKGATIINARGSGIHETGKLFAMEIEPEKEIVLMITKSEQTGKIVASIKNNFQIDKPGNGIIFVQNVDETYGLVE